MSISSTGLGSATIVNSDLFTDVETLKETVTTLNTTDLQTTEEHRTDISQNRADISSNLSKINDISTNKIPDLILDISKNTSAINDISTNKIPNLILDISSNLSKINDISTNKIPNLILVHGRSLGSGVGAGGRCLAPLVGGVRWSDPPLHRRGSVGAVYGRSRGGPGDAVSSRDAGSGMRGRLGWCGVRCLFQGCFVGRHLGRGATAAWGAGALRKGS